MARTIAKRQAAAIKDPRSYTDAEWSDYVAYRRDRHQHPRSVTLTGEQVRQLSSIIGQASEILHCARLLYEFPEQWAENLRSIRSTASTIRYFAKAPRQRYLPPADAAIAAELLGGAADD